MRDLEGKKRDLEKFLLWMETGNLVAGSSQQQSVVLALANYFLVYSIDIICYLFRFGTELDKHVFRDEEHTFSYILPGLVINMMIIRV